MAQHIDTIKNTLDDLDNAQTKLRDDTAQSTLTVLSQLGDIKRWRHIWHDRLAAMQLQNEFMMKQLDKLMDTTSELGLVIFPRLVVFESQTFARVNDYINRTEEIYNEDDDDGCGRYMEGCSFRTCELTPDDDLLSQFSKWFDAIMGSPRCADTREMLFRLNPPTLEMVQVLKEYLTNAMRPFQDKPFEDMEIAFTCYSRKTDCNVTGKKQPVFVIFPYAFSCKVRRSMDE